MELWLHLWSHFISYFRQAKVYVRRILKKGSDGAKSIVKPEKVKKLDMKMNRKELEVGTVNSHDVGV